MAHENKYQNSLQSLKFASRIAFKGYGKVRARIKALEGIYEAILRLSKILNITILSTGNSETHEKYIKLKEILFPIDPIFWAL